MTKNPVIKFGALLLLILTIPFVIQLTVHQSWGEPMYGAFIIPSYCFNFSYAVASVVFLLMMQKKKSKQLGFAYLGMSMLKFILFLSIFIPLLNADDEIDNFEFSAFFVPYATCLVLEPLYLVRLLNK